MELKDFIRETLVQIARGIEEADEDLKESKALINPKNVSVDYSGKAQLYGFLLKNRDDDKPRVVQAIEFDVAVHAKEGSEASAKGGISVGSVGFGGKAGTSESKSSESRIKFKIPMILPEGQ